MTIISQSLVAIYYSYKRFTAAVAIYVAVLIYIVSLDANEVAI